MGVLTRILDSALLVRIIGHVTASPNLPPAYFWVPLAVLGTAGNRDHYPVFTLDKELGVSAKPMRPVQRVLFM